MKKQLITFRHLERLFTSQEYFVWNSNFDNAINSLDEEDDEINENSLWEIFTDFELEELDDYKFVEIIKNGFDKVNDIYKKFVLDWAQNENKSVVVIHEKSNELAFNKTIEAIKDNNIDWIINPVFMYEDLISKPSLYRKDTSELFSMIYASKSKLKYYLKAYFDFNIAKKLNIKVNEYLFFTFDKEKDYENPNELSFNYFKYCWTQKQGPSKDTKATIEQNCDNQTIIEKLKSGIIKTKINQKTKIKEFEIVLNISDFDEYINQIREAKEIKEQPESVNFKDNTPWGVNPNFIQMFNYAKYNLKKVSGNLLNKNELLEIEEGKSIHNFISKKNSLKLVMNNQCLYDKNVMKEYIDKIENKKVVWFDFEGFSMPYTILAHTKPYQQLVFQLSIIRTENEKIIYKNNIVVDPKKISVKDFIEIINEIYWDEADSYVIYNKSYEFPRMKEMLELIYKDNELNKFYEQTMEKYNQIEVKRVDLLELFNISKSNNEIPPIFICDLLGYSSIKKLEQLITKNNYQFDVMITPYKELEVQNGLMAMNKAIQRYLDSIGDNEWEITSKNLATYCENDVKAMIMVYYFVKYLYENE